EYFDLLLKYIMLGRTSQQTACFLRGLYEVIPPVLLSVFDYKELELVMCGLPNIDVSDWRKHTQYRGVYAENPKQEHKVVQWFWQCMNEFSDVDRARFLQFSTGTSRVPVQGFGYLQGSDGDI